MWTLLLRIFCVCMPDFKLLNSKNLHCSINPSGIWTWSICLDCTYKNVFLKKKTKNKTRGLNSFYDRNSMIFKISNELTHCYDETGFECVFDDQTSANRIMELYTRTVFFNLVNKRRWINFGYHKKGIFF